MDPTAQAAEAAHAEIWRRFVDPDHDTLYHYAGPNGEVILPSPDDCALARPNGMSWSTPIEDGPFFGGLYLAGLCRRWEARQDAEAAESARRIAGGLVTLARAGKTPGFIARGLASDGRSHYPASSEDQTFPWFYGLWRYARSGLANAAEMQALVGLMQNTALALEQHGWRIPCARSDYGYRGSYVRATAYDSSRLLFLQRALFELTQDERWLAAYLSRLDERLGNPPLTRLALCAGGLDYGSPDNPSSCIWTTAMAQAALAGLVEMESAPELLGRYQAGLEHSARNAAWHLQRHRRFDAGSGADFDADWRFLNATWLPQATCEEAIALARSQLPLWAAHNPRSPHEDDTMREPLFAAWVVTLCGDRALLTEHRQAIRALLGHYPWRQLYTSTFFIAECVYYEGLRHGL